LLSHYEGGGAIRPFPRAGGLKEIRGYVKVGPRPKLWARSKKWKKYSAKWRAGETQMRKNAEGCP